MEERTYNTQTNIQIVKKIKNRHQSNAIQIQNASHELKKPKITITPTKSNFKMHLMRLKTKKTDN